MQIEEDAAKRIEAQVREMVEKEYSEKLGEEKRKMMVEFERSKLELAVEHEQEMELFQQQNSLRLAAFRQEAEEQKTVAVRRTQDAVRA